MKYYVDFTDQNGATVGIDNIIAPISYSAEQYIEDCRKHADDDWFEMLQTGTVTLIPHTYYIADGQHADRIYGDQEPVCISEDEVRRLSQEWDDDLFQTMREATKDEIAQYGCYD